MELHPANLDVDTVRVLFPNFVGDSLSDFALGSNLTESVVGRSVN